MEDDVRIFSEPEEDEQTLWRYTSLAKLLNVIRMGDSKNTAKLVAKRTDKFEDEYEGTLSDEARDKATDNAASAYELTYDGRYGGPPSISHITKDEEKQEQVRKDLVEGPIRWINNRHKMANHMRKITFANCWRCDRYESSNMWRAYTTPSDGVVIRTTFENLQNSLRNWNGELYLGDVKYINFDEDDMSIEPISPFFYKQTQFSDESEVRMILTDYEGSNLNPAEGVDGLPDSPNDSLRFVSVNTDILFDEIRVHPESGNYLRQVVEKSLRKLGVDVDVEHSSLRTSLS